MTVLIVYCSLCHVGHPSESKQAPETLEVPRVHHYFKNTSKVGTEAYRRVTLGSVQVPVHYQEMSYDSGEKQKQKHTVAMKADFDFISNSTSCLMRTVDARFLPNTTYCPMVKSRCQILPVVRQCLVVGLGF